VEYRAKRVEIGPRRKKIRDGTYAALCRKKAGETPGPGTWGRWSLFHEMLVRRKTEGVAKSVWEIQKTEIGAWKEL